MLDLLLFFNLLVLFAMLLEIHSITSKQWVCRHVAECHSLSTVNHKDVKKKVFQLWRDIFELVHLNCIFELEAVQTLLLNIEEKIVAFKRIVSKQHEEEKDTEGPDVYRSSIRKVLQDFRGHVFLGSTDSAGSA